MTAFFEDLRAQPVDGNDAAVLHALEVAQQQPFTDEVGDEFWTDAEDEEDDDEEEDDPPMAPIPPQASPPTPVGVGEGMNILKEKCGGSFEKKKAKSTKARRAAVAKVWEAFILQRQTPEDESEPPLSELTEDSVDTSKFFLLYDENNNIIPRVHWQLVLDFGAHYINSYCAGNATTSQWNKFLDAVQEWTDDNLVDAGFNKSKGLIRSNEAFASAQIGILILYRHNILQEPFPDFVKYHEDDIDSYCNRPLIRAITHWKDEIAAGILCGGWNSINRAVSILVEKVTHQNRVEFTEDLFDKGCADNIAQRLGGHVQENSGVKKMNASVKTSYSLFPPAAGVAAVGGGDPKHPDSFLALWTTVTDGLDDVIHELAPWYYEQRRLVDQQIRLVQLMAGSSKEAEKQMEKQRLFMADGALESTYLRLQRVVQLAALAAARGYDSKLRLQVDSEPFYKRWGENPIFQLAAFKSDAFSEFAAKMADVQEMQHRHQVDVPLAIKNEVERAVNLHVVQPMNRNNAHSAALHSEVKQLRAENQEFRKMLEGVFNHITGGSEEERASAAQPTHPRQLFTPAQRIETTEEPSIPTLTKDGKVRTRAPRRNIREILGGTTLWSPSLVTAKQFWDEFDKGLDGRIPLRDLEDEQGPAWRTDTMIKEVPGGKRPSAALKVGWSNRTPIYNYILYRTEMSPDPIPLWEAQEEVDNVMNNYLSTNKRPKLAAVAKALRTKLEDEFGVVYKTLPYPRLKTQVPVSRGTL